MNRLRAAKNAIVKAAYELKSSHVSEKRSKKITNFVVVMIGW